MVIYEVRMYGGGRIAEAAPLFARSAIKRSPIEGGHFICEANKEGGLPRHSNLKLKTEARVRLPHHNPCEQCESECPRYPELRLI